MVSRTLPFMLAFLSTILFYANSKVGVYTVYNYSTAVFQCIAKNGYSNASFSIISSSSGIDKNLISSNLYNIKNAGLGQSLWYAPCRSNNAGQQFHDFLKKVNKQVYDKIWIYFYSTAWEICSWEVNSPASNCKYLGEVIQHFKTNKIGVGVVASQSLWQHLFKNKCDQMGLQQLFWIPESPDGKQDFNDFKPFAGWKMPTVKLFQYGKQISACGANVFLYYF